MSQSIKLAGMVLTILLVGFGCSNDAADTGSNRNLSPLAQHSGPTIRVDLIHAEELPDEFDLSRTYWYEATTVEPEALLISLWNAGIRVSTAWEALDDQCFNPIGTRFTVELASENERILTLGFHSGEGSLYCASQLNRYTVSE